MRYWGNRVTPSVGMGLEWIVLQVKSSPKIKTQRWERPSKAGVKHIRGAIMYDKWLPLVHSEDK